MDFTSDNTGALAPQIRDALLSADAGRVPSYGNDPWSQALDRAFAEVFGAQVRVFPVATGTAANALALAHLIPPWGAVLCHEEAHIHTDECGAPEFFSAGGKLVPIGGDHGRLDPSAVAATLAEFPPGSVHQVQPAALSLSQSTEAGTVYGPDAVANLCATARTRGMRVHMDGARFANALAGRAAAPAALTWQAGVDVLAFGATKNGAMMAEAVVFFDLALAEGFALRRKRAGQLLSKSRYVAAQLLAYLADDLWLRLAAHANVMAGRLGVGLKAEGYASVHPVEANEVFVRLPDAMAAALRRGGALFYDWPSRACGPDGRRFVTSFASRAEEVDELLALVRAG
ncbi:beta-eliminating lyase-related protein [Xanthobacter sp. KR7-65]|uniref:threonine aldolase family protein n=1 Tax=Xanthobacter sp. KR7-65 TaxID=3156612 RepID=UPI0032B513E6